MDNMQQYTTHKQFAGGTKTKSAETDSFKYQELCS